MATTFDKASLVMIPSGVKEDKLYSIKPTDGSGDFTFSRGSDIQATRVNSSGLIEKAKVNLTSWSNDLNNWIKDNASVTSGQSGYDGSADAWRIDSTGGFVRRDATYSGVVTHSIYAKAGTAVGIRIRLDAASDANCYFNLSTGAEISHTGIALKANDLGGGWYRLEFAANITTGINHRVYPVDATGTATTGNIFVQDSQINHGLIAQDYVETTTTAVVEGLTADLPRLDYSGGASCPSLLLEPSRTNVFDYSEYLNAWIKGNISIVSNAAISPEGVQNATTIDVVSAASFASIRRNISVSANSTYTMSLFVKKETSETNYMGLGFIYSGGTTDVGYVIIDSVNGTAVSADPRIDVITNVVDFGDYWRIEATATDSGSNTSLAAYIYATLSINGTSVGVGTGSTRTIYGAQLEAGSYATSYIPTYGTAAVRGFDSCSKTGITSLIGQTEGTLFAELIAQETDSSQSVAISDGTSSNRLDIRLTTSNTIAMVGVFGGSVVLSQASTETFSTGDVLKIALAYANNDFALYLNGAEVASVSSGSVSGTLSTFGLNLNGGQLLNSAAKQALLFKTRLTNAELVALTTI
jgi:hypothetical protein